MKRIIVIAGLVASLAAAPAAQAESEAYGAVQGLPAQASPVATTSAPVTIGGKQLPFTGLDLAIVIAAGLVLLGVGVGLRRAGSRESA